MTLVEIRLVKEMGYERINCVCGMAVLPKDPTPEITLMIKEIAVKEGAKFSIIDTSVHPEVLDQYNISDLPAVIIGKKAYPVEEDIIRSAIKKERT